MPVVVNATSGDPAANSYLTVLEFQAYLETAFDPNEVADALDDGPTLVMATRMMEALYSPSRHLIRPATGSPYYIMRPTWTGAVATATQRLLWPRIGMFTRTGVAIGATIIPQELKEATAELARQLKKGDRTLDNDVAVQGITAVRAGSVSVNFKNEIDVMKAIPDIVFQMLVPSWLTDELYEPAMMADFNVVSEI